MAVGKNGVRRRGRSTAKPERGLVAVISRENRERSPVCMLLYALLPITQSIMQTAVTAVATANFVDTATAILTSARPYQDRYHAHSQL